MNRRKFLQFLGAGAGVAAVAAVPGAVKFFLPPKGGWRGEWTYSTKDMYLSLDDFEARILQPAIIKVADRIDGLMAGDIFSIEGVRAPSGKLKLFKVSYA